MKKQRKTVSIIFIAVILLVLSSKLCNAFAYAPFLDQIDRWPDGGDFYPEDYYSINPNTIIADLDKGLLNTFSPIAEPPDNFWADYDSSFLWNQSDFVKTATAFNYVVGKDDITDWSYSMVVFRSTCKDFHNGFLDAHFILFRPFWSRGQLYYEAREIYIDPSLSIVRWGDGRIYPRPIMGWSKIKLDKFNITADEAVTIAEENGGKELCLAEGEKSKIFVGGNDDEWSVSFSPINEYRINAYTGKIMEIREFR